MVQGAVVELDAKGATIALGDGVEGYLRASEISRDRIEDARTVLKVGEEVEAKFLGVDRKNRTISLSIKAKDMEEEAATLKGYSSGGARRDRDPGRHPQGADGRGAEGLTRPSDRPGPPRGGGRVGTTPTPTETRGA